MAGKKLSFVDHAWWRMDDPSNRMIITGLMTFSQPLDYERLKAVVSYHLLRFDRFRQRVKASRLPLTLPDWDFDPEFNLENHIQRVSLPEPAGQAQLLEFVSNQMSAGLDPQRPLWKFFLIEKYNGGGSALVGRLHHAIADGIALVQVILSMTDSDPQVSLPDAEPPASLERRRAWMDDQLQRARVRMQRSIDNSQMWLNEGARMLTEPGVARQYLRQGRKLATATAKLALRWPDPRTVFKGPLSPEKRAALARPIPLEDVKRLGGLLGGTVNDVLLTAVAGGLRRYFQYRGDRVVEWRDIRGVIPVNLRPIELGTELGNQFGLVFLSMPVSEADPLQRLALLRRNMNELKASAEPVAAFGLLNVIGAVPPLLEDIAISIFDSKGTAVMTNVPGPRQQLYLAGAPIEQVMAWVPQTGRVSLGVSIISYNGQVLVGFATDAGLAPDPERIVAGFEEEWAELVRLGEGARSRRRSESLARAIDELEQAIKKLEEG